jgi:hypothetical protein
MALSKRARILIAFGVLLFGAIGLFKVYINAENEKFREREREAVRLQNEASERQRHAQQKAKEEQAKKDEESLTRIEKAAKAALESGDAHLACSLLYFNCTDLPQDKVEECSQKKTFDYGSVPTIRPVAVTTATWKTADCQKLLPEFETKTAQSKAALERDRLPKPKFTLTPSQLRREFDSNPNAAQAKFSDELVRIRGSVKEFTGFGNDSVLFGDGGGGTTAEFANGDDVLKLKVGMKVTFLCEVNELGSFDFIRLRKCIVEEPAAQVAGVEGAAPSEADWAAKTWRCDMGNGIKFQFALAAAGDRVGYSVNMMNAQSDQGKMKISKLKYGSTKTRRIGEYGEATPKEISHVDVWTNAEPEMLQRFRLLRRTSGVQMFGELDGKIGGQAVADCQ